MFVLFLIALTVFKEWIDWKNFFIVNVAVGVVQSLVALYQIINPNFFNPFNYPVTRVYGLFGNPSFLASYLLFVLFISLFLFLRHDGIKLKLFSALSFVVLSATIIMTGTRGTIFGALFGATVFLLIYGVFSKKSIHRLVVAIFILMLIIGGLFLYANKNKPWIDSIPVVKRVINIKSEIFTLSTREIFWRSAWDGFKDRPILGWGPENFNLVFNKHYNPGILTYGAGESWPTKPHNIFLEQLSTGGIIGLLSFLSVFVMVGYLLFKKFRKNPDDLLIFSVFTSLLVAHLIQNIVFFDTQYSYYMLFIIFGFIAYQPNTEKIIFSDKPIDKNNAKTFLFILLALIAYLSYMNVNMYRSALYINDYDSRLFETKSFYGDDFRVEFAKIFLDGKMKFKSEEERTWLVSKLNSELDGVVRNHPQNIFDRAFKIQILTELGIADSKYLDEAESLINEEISANPNRQQMYLFLGRIYVLRKDYGKAIENYRKAVQLDSGSLIGHWYLGVTLYTDKQTEEGLRELDIAYKGGYTVNNSAQLNFWALIYAMNKEFNKSISLYDRAISSDPKNPLYYEKLAAVYKEVGDKEKAIAMVNKAVELNPELASEAEQFITTLK